MLYLCPDHPLEAVIACLCVSLLGFELEAGANWSGPLSYQGSLAATPE